jgi:hypothetical protein
MRNRDSVANEAIRTKKEAKKQVDYFWKHQKSISDYESVSGVPKWVRDGRLFIVSARTNESHHHHH